MILCSQNQQFFFKDQRGLPNLIYRTPLNKDITVNIMNKKTKLKNFLNQVSGNFIVRDCRGGYAVYTSKTEGPNNLSFYSNMTVTGSYPDIDKDGDAVLVIVIDSWY